MNTLVVHEWLAPVGGSENVFEQIRGIFPEARVACLWNDAPDRFGRDVEETWLARTPLRRSKALAFPFLSKAWNSVGLEGVERLVASSHASSHHLASRAAELGIASFAYVHSPPRYIWAPELDRRGAKWPARVGRRHFQRVDQQRISRRVSIAANSQFIRARIANSWGMDSTVIYPPVDVERIQSVQDWREEIEDPAELAAVLALPECFVLGASRLVPYKRLDSAILAGERLDLPVVIVGSGPDEERLRALAGRSRVPVTFFGRASTPALYALYQRTSLFVFLAIEDFGIMPVEAMAVGTPVLVPTIGGARESVESVGGGIAIGDSDTLSDLAEIPSIDQPRVINEVRRFSRETFIENVITWVGEP